jgi:hypothetical protein
MRTIESIRRKLGDISFAIRNFTQRWIKSLSRKYSVSWNFLIINS